MNVLNIYGWMVCTSLRLIHQRRAVTAIEYGLVAALIAVVIIGAVGSLGHGVSNTFIKVAGEL